jgi:iron complex transport system substrate-binding protein
VVRRLSLVGTALLAACAQPQQAEQAARPTIVSLNPCADAILAEVAEPAQLLAISHYSHDPRSTSMDLAEARRFRATGGTVEEVLALGPDLVVAGGFLPPATRAAFERLGIRVETFGVPGSVAGSEAQVRRLAALAGQEERGEMLIARIDEVLERIRRGGERPSALLWQQGGIVAGPDALVTQLLVHTGFASHAAARGLGQGAYLPLEQVLADPPDVILSAGGERALAHPILKSLPGTYHAKLDPSLTFCGGPTIVRAAERLASLRHDIR